MAKIEGLDQLIKRFQAVPQNIEKKVLNKALRAGAKVYLDSLKQHVDSLPISSSGKRRIKRSLILRPIRSRRMAKGSVSFGVKIRTTKNRDDRNKSTDPWWYFLFEEGTAERFRETSRTNDGTRKHLKSPAATGHIEGHHFIRDALSSAKSAAVNAIEQTAKAEFDKAGTI